MNTEPYPTGVRPDPPLRISATESHERTNGRTDGEDGHLPDVHVDLGDARAKLENQETRRWKTGPATRRVAAVVTLAAIFVCSGGTEAWGRHTSTWENHPTAVGR